MKKIFTMLLVMLTVQASAQTYPITSITISLPANPDANMAKWGSGTNLFNITANTKAVNGKVDGRVQESKILIIIKKNGTKICGTYSSTTAPASNFNNLTKVWSGANAVSLVGQSCTLTPGEYELSVQLFGYGPAGKIAYSEEKVKAFTIRSTEQQISQSPQAIAPANNSSISENNIPKPITFRWTPVIPRPQEPVSYKVRVWQLMQGQNGAQALHVNPPIITKDVDNLTQALLSLADIGPCKPPYLCEFVWNVQALGRDGKPIGGNNGTSETFNFKREQQENNALVKLLSPANNGTISSNQKLRFSWTPSRVPNVTYSIRIVKINSVEPSAKAFHNKPFFEKDSPSYVRTNKPHFEKDSLEWLVAGNQYAWNIQVLSKEGKPIGANNGKSEVFTFKVIATKPQNKKR